MEGHDEDQVPDPKLLDQSRTDLTGLGDGHGKRRVSETSGEHSHEGLTEQLLTVNLNDYKQ